MVQLAKCTQQDEKNIGYEESNLVSEMIGEYKLSFVKL